MHAVAKTQVSIHSTGNLNNVELGYVSVRQLRVVFIALVNHKIPQIMITSDTNNSADNYLSSPKIAHTNAKLNRTALQN